MKKIIEDGRTILIIEKSDTHNFISMNDLQATNITKEDLSELFKNGLSLGENLKDLKFDLEYFNQSIELSKPYTIDTQISNLKSQLRYCKNPLQKLNTEKEINRLNRERGKK